MDKVEMEPLWLLMESFRVQMLERCSFMHTIDLVASRKRERIRERLRGPLVARTTTTTIVWNNGGPNKSRKRVMKLRFNFAQLNTTSGSEPPFELKKRTTSRSNEAKRASSSWAKMSNQCATMHSAQLHWIELDLSQVSLPDICYHQINWGQRSSITDWTLTIKRAQRNPNELVGKSCWQTPN